MLNRSHQITSDIVFYLLVFFLSYGAWVFLVTATLEGNLEE